LLREGALCACFKLVIDLLWNLVQDWVNQS